MVSSWDVQSVCWYMLATFANTTAASWQSHVVAEGSKSDHFDDHLQQEDDLSWTPDPLSCYKFG